MLKWTRRFISFRGTFMPVRQKHNYETYSYLSFVADEKKLLISNSYGYDINVELRKRLSSIPYKNLLKCGEDTVSQDLMFDKNKALANVMERIEKVFHYNAKHSGKIIRSIALLSAYCTYRFDLEDENWNAWDSDGWKKAVVLAWCMEIFQAFIIIYDDLMDQSVLRRGQPCWYKLPDVGLRAIFDGSLMISGIYKVLQENFGSSICYQNLIQEFVQTLEKTINGQTLEMMCNPPNQRPTFELFTFDRFNTILEHKASHYSFCLPVRLAMHLVGGYSQSYLDFATQLCVILGKFYQIQNDYMDCFGNPAVTRKLGNDIQEGKCTWASVQFLETASDSEKEEFKKHFGCSDEASISKILKLYNQSSLQEEYRRTVELLESEVAALVKSKEKKQDDLFIHLFSEIKKIKIR